MGKLVRQYIDVPSEYFIPPFGAPDKFGFFFVIIMAFISILLIAYWLYLRYNTTIVP